MTHTTHLLDPKRGRASAYRKWTLCGEQVRTALVFSRHRQFVAEKEITCRVCLLAEAVPELRAALESAIDTIRIWHGAAFVGSAIADPNRNLYKKAWEHYRTNAPEMKLLYAALEKTAAATALAPAVPPASLAQKQKGEKS
jgi:hypothetical protein